MLNIGETVPSFTLPCSQINTLSVPTGSPLILYFYPKDNTAGCTTEAIDFTNFKPKFTTLGVDIVGISPDPISTHDKFIAKHELAIKLASDEDHRVSELFGVWIEKNMYGRTYMGIQRSTFLIDGRGKILSAWHKVRVKGHVESVFAEAQNQFC